MWLVTKMVQIMPKILDFGLSLGYSSILSIVLAVCLVSLSCWEKNLHIGLGFLENEKKIFSLELPCIRFHLLFAMLIFSGN